MAVATSEPEVVTNNLYEGMFLLDSGTFAANPEEVTQHVLDFLEKANAEVVAHRPWLDGRLAYEIEGKRRGVHYLVYFKMPGAGVAEVTRRCKLSELVMRPSGRSTIGFTSTVSRRLSSPGTSAATSAVAT